jgi:hypothetical protein
MAKGLVAAPEYLDPAVLSPDLEHRKFYSNHLAIIDIWPHTE